MKSKKKPKAKATAPIKKITRRRRKISPFTIDPNVIADIDQVYQAINRVQVAREEATLLVMDTESVIIDNILKDLTLPFTKTIKADEKFSCVEYVISPGPEQTSDHAFDELDDFPDELLEDGQIFFE